MERKRNISRMELKDDIATLLMGWIEFPLAYSEVIDIISDAVRLTETSPRPIQWREDIRPFVFSAMTKNPLINGVDCFISALKDELQAYNLGTLHDYSRRLRIPIPIHSVLLAVRESIHTKPMQTSIPSHRVREQITLFGQYAILSHRWYQDEEELSFVDVSNISDPGVQAKKGFRKLIGFSNVVKSLYGSRYLWVDSACIDEADRNASIPLMFAWYRRAYVCVIYFSTISSAATSDTPFASRDPWSTRGWTLQEFLAPNRIVCFTNDWHPAESLEETHKFHACRGSKLVSLLYHDLRSTTGYVEWEAYNPGIDHAISLMRSMQKRKTTKDEDMVYSILSALDVTMPVEYGEGFDRAFYRLQAAILTQTNDRRLLLWRGATSASSPFNSMLAGSFTAWDEDSVWYNSKDMDHRYSAMENFDPTVSFDSNGVMRIMVALHPLNASQTHVFALMAKRGDAYMAIVLRRCGGQIYQRIGLRECKVTNVSSDKAPEWVYVK
ncbi:hypothetical protein CCMSSC00406_0008914 [Pleurotus cornucopiae]|uniref:Uncharacterized protein n=1 Tax=Pleurotus cornucopiae TaxID=5321 RepID=A0ACB7IUG1_PLECO|nr:hypothetical protein CCMSSC00406_0008914 [Pleurotus cornucopiae]